MEKYMAFMLGNHLVFLDSFQFMSSSLDNLVKNLPDEAFKYTKQEFKKEQFNLMKQKGIYPYDHMDSSTGSMKPNYLKSRTFTVFKQ